MPQYIIGIPKPTKFGCYAKTDQQQNLNFTVRELSNAGIDSANPASVGVTQIDIQTVLPDHDFLDNTNKPDIVCYVIEGQGEIFYCFDNACDHFEITQGDTILIPRDSVYGLKGKMRVLFVSTPQWKLKGQQRVSID